MHELVGVSDVNDLVGLFVDVNTALQTLGFLLPDVNLLCLKNLLLVGLRHVFFDCFDGLVP